VIDHHHDRPTVPLQPDRLEDDVPGLFVDARGRSSSITAAAVPECRPPDCPPGHTPDSRAPFFSKRRGGLTTRGTSARPLPRFACRASPVRSQNMRFCRTVRRGASASPGHIADHAPVRNPRLDRDPISEIRRHPRSTEASTTGESFYRAVVAAAPSTFPGSTQKETPADGSLL
jgi:hypothetical protein